MRNDCTFDKKQVIVRNARLLGYGKSRAQYGDFIIYNDNDQKTLARVVGRIASTQLNERALIGHLVVIVINERLTHCFERWINPADVIECISPKNYKRQALIQFFTSESFGKGKNCDTRKMCAWSDSGFQTMEDFDARHKYAKNVKY